MKTCIGCKKEKELPAFQLKSDGQYREMCRECRDEQNKLKAEMLKKKAVGTPQQIKKD